MGTVKITLPDHSELLFLQVATLPAKKPQPNPKKTPNPKKPKLKKKKPKQFTQVPLTLKYELF